MKIYNLNNSQKVENPHNVDVKNFIKNEKVIVNVLTLEAKQSLKKHSSPVNVIFYILEGEGIFESNDEKITVVKDTAIESFAGDLHCFYNESNSVLKILVIKLQ